MSEAPELLMLDADAVRRLFTIDVALDSQRRAFRALASGDAVLPPRLLVPGADDAVAFCYAARLSPDSSAVSKFGSVNPANAAAGLPAIAALISVLDARTGRPAAVMDGTVVTTLRTAAASAVALDVLAPAQVQRLAIYGTGVQAEAHLDACLAVRPLTEVVVVGRRRESAEAFVAAAAEARPELTFRVAEAEEAASSADVVALCTTSSTPVVRDAWIRPGTTILGVGSFAPDRHEFDTALLRRARLVVDDPATAATDCGPVVAALDEGILSRDDLVGLGDLLLGRAHGRRDPDDITLFSSVGVGIQDAAAAEAVAAAAHG